jgi:hypothetical protein
VDQVIAQQRREALLLDLGRQLPPVLLAPGRLNPAVDHLDRLVTALDEDGAQRRMALHHAVPRAPERRGVEVAAQQAAQLHDVLARAGIGEGVEEHPLLHGRQRVDVLDQVAAAQTLSASSSRSSKRSSRSSWLSFTREKSDGV